MFCLLTSLALFVITTPLINTPSINFSDGMATFISSAPKLTIQQDRSDLMNHARETESEAFSVVNLYPDALNFVGNAESVSFTVGNKFPDAMNNLSESESAAFIIGIQLTDSVNYSGESESDAFTVGNRFSDGLNYATEAESDAFTVRNQFPDDLNYATEAESGVFTVSNLFPDDLNHAAEAESSIFTVENPFPLQFVTTQLPFGWIDRYYSSVIETTGGISPREISILSGDLPSGLNLNLQTNEIVGIPTKAGEFTFIIRMTDFMGDICDQSYTIYIGDDKVVIPINFLDIANGSINSENETIVYQLSVNEPSQASILFRHSIKEQQVHLRAPNGDYAILINTQPLHEIPSLFGSTQEIPPQEFYSSVDFNQKGTYEFIINGFKGDFLLLLGPNTKSSIVPTSPGNEEGLVSYVDGVDWESSFPNVTLTVRIEENGVPATHLTKESFLNVLETHENQSQELPILDIALPHSGDRAVDIVFCFDDSGSMKPPQEKVQRNIQSLTRQLQERKFDVRLGLLRNGHNYVSAPNGGPIPLMDKWDFFTPKVESFLQWFDVFEFEAGVGKEPTFDSIVFAGGYPFRPGAQRVFIAITDEESNNDLFSKNEALLAITENSGVLFAIINLKESDNGATEEQFINDTGLVTMTNGRYFNIEEDSYESILELIGKQIGNTYQIKYRSPFTSFDGIKRLGELRIQDGNNSIKGFFDYTVPYIDDAIHPTPTLSDTYTPAPRLTPTPTPAPHTPTPTLTYTLTPTNTPTRTYTPIAPTTTSTSTATPTKTSTPIWIATPTPSPTRISTVLPTTTETPEPNTPTPMVSYLCTNDFALQHVHSLFFDSRPKGLIANDFNNDGIVDLLTSLPSENVLVVMTSTPEDIQPAMAHYVPVSFETEYYACGDLNGDSFLDIAVVSFIDNKVTILWGDKNLLFSENTTFDIPYSDIYNTTTQGFINPVTCFDTNFDNIDELYLIQNESLYFNSITKYEFTNKTHNPIKSQVTITGIPDQDLRSIQFIKNSFQLILSVLGTDSKTLFLCSQNNDGIYRVESIFPFDETFAGNYPVAYTQGDVGEDSNTDIAVIPFDGSIRLIKSIEQQFTQSQIGNLGDTAIHDDLIIIDLDQDNVKDILVISREKTSLNSHLQIQVVCGKNADEFKEYVTFTTAQTSSQSPFTTLQLDVLDINYDGLDDIAILDTYNKEVLFIQNISNTKIHHWLLHD